MATCVGCGLEVVSGVLRTRQFQSARLLSSGAVAIADGICATPLSGNITLDCDTNVFMVGQMDIVNQSAAGFVYAQVRLKVDGVIQQTTNANYVPAPNANTGNIGEGLMVWEYAQMMTAGTHLIEIEICGFAGNATGTGVFLFTFERDMTLIWR